MIKYFRYALKMRSMLKKEKAAKDCRNKRRRIQRYEREIIKEIYKRQGGK